MKNISQSGVRAIRLACPQIPEQSRITARLDAVIDAIGAMKTHLTKLRHQKLGLMHDLLNGRVRAKVTEPEEVPA